MPMQGGINPPRGSQFPRKKPKDRRYPTENSEEDHKTPEFKVNQPWKYPWMRGKKKFPPGMMKKDFVPPGQAKKGPDYEAIKRRMRKFQEEYQKKNKNSY